ncbi:MAG: RND transporter, partial [Flavitalea sp.]
SQTQNIIIRVNETAIPTNLIAKVRIEKDIRPYAVSLPKQSLLSDETQSVYWVMKLIDSITAVKIPVTKGLEIGDRVEILSPQFLLSDKFILTGNFGLTDTARVRIIQQ